MATVGEQLRRAREASALSVKGVAEKTKMRADHVTALEEGNYGVFVAPVYIRGFVRTYGRLVKLDEATLLTALDEELSQTDKYKEHPSLTGEEPGALDHLMLVFARVKWRFVLPVIAVLLLALVLLVVDRAMRSRQADEPLSDIGPGLYEPNASSQEMTLPLPTNATTGQSSAR